MKYDYVLGIIASIFLVASQTSYIHSVAKKRVCPNILPWFSWGVIISSAWVSQFIEIGWEWSAIGVLLSGVGCLVIATLGLSLKNYLIDKKDWYFLFVGIVCFILYLTSKNPWLTTIYAILADLLLAVPMIIKAYKFPKTEKTIAWYFSAISWTIATYISFFDEIIFRIFPIYLLLFSVLMIILMNKKSNNINYKK